MHEMSVIESLLETVAAQLRPYPNARLRRLHVRVGRLRQIEPEMLAFCYEAAVTGTPLADSELCLEQTEPTARCRVCSLRFDVQDAWFECPRCHAADTELLSGDELVLNSIDIEKEGTRASRDG